MNAEKKGIIKPGLSKPHAGSCEFYEYNGSRATVATEIPAILAERLAAISLVLCLTASEKRDVFVTDYTK